MSHHYRQVTVQIFISQGRLAHQSSDPKAICMPSLDAYAHDRSNVTMELLTFLRPPPNP